MGNSGKSDPSEGSVQIRVSSLNNRDAVVESHIAAKYSAKEERAFVWTLDLLFLTVGFLGYMFKYIDQTNVSNAYVSGMKEDLSLYGNQYNYFTTYFNIGYMIMLYPSCVIVSRFGPSKWLPACELIWGVLTCCLSTVTTAEQVYGLRFLIGFFEAVTWPGYYTIISQWYTPNEMALRMALYDIAQPVGAMLSGAMQGGLSTNFEGLHGRSGWRWAFIINGVCTIAIALVAFFVLPGFPDRPNPLAKFYLTPRNLDIGRERLRRVRRKPLSGLTFKSFFRCFTFWQLWAFGLAWPFGNNSTPSKYFNLWLKSLTNSDGTAKYTTAMVNYLPMGGQGALIVGEIIMTGMSDYFGVRLPFLLLHSAISITSLVILVIRPSNNQAYMAGWYMNFMGDVSTKLLCAWASSHLEDEPEVRTILFASGTVVAYLLAATIPISAFPASEAPNWRLGAKVYLGFAIAAAFTFVAIHFAFKWDRNRKSKNQDDTNVAQEFENPSMTTKVEAHFHGEA